MPRSFVKDPDAVLDYEFDWSAWLRDDSIAAYTVIADEGLTIVEHSATATAVTVWLAGGLAGKTYPVTCHIVTAAGREDDRTLTVIVREQ